MIRAASTLAAATISVLMSLWLVPAHAAPPERIFANGFEPCCRIGGTVSGLAGAGLVLHLAFSGSVEDKPIAGNGLFNFIASVPPGTAYTLDVAIQPDGQTCALSITAGAMGGADVDNADATCTATLEWDGGRWGQDWN